MTLRTYLLSTVSWPLLRQPRLGAREMADALAWAYGGLMLKHLDKPI